MDRFDDQDDTMPVLDDEAGDEGRTIQHVARERVPSDGELMQLCEV